MGLKDLGKLFMGGGLAMLVYGIFMDTSVSTGYGRVVNIGLANDRLMFILIGGFVFVGGVILFGVFKAKQTKEDELAEQEQIDARNAQRKAQVVGLSQSIAARVAKDNVIWRLAHGVGIAFLINGLASLVHPPDVVTFLLYVVSLVMAFRPIEYRTVIAQCWLVAVVASVYLALHTFLTGKILGWLPCLVVALISYLVSRRYRKN